MKAMLAVRVILLSSLVALGCSEESSEGDQTSTTGGIAGVGGSSTSAGGLANRGTQSGGSGQGGAAQGGRGDGGSGPGGAPAVGGSGFGGTPPLGGSGPGGAPTLGGSGPGGSPPASGGSGTGGTPSAGTGQGGTGQGGSGEGGAPLALGGTGEGGTGEGGEPQELGGEPEGGTGQGGAEMGGDGSGGNGHTGVWKVMPLGDSITGTTCYPQLLSQKFIDEGHTNFEFVGTNLNNQSCNGAPSLQTEGHGGYFVTYLTTDSPPQSGKGTLTEMRSWSTAAPDIVLLHMGTNDCWGGSIDAPSIIAAYETIMAQFRSENPNAIFFVSKIIPLNPNGCGTCMNQVSTLDALITESWASEQTTSTSPVYIIDHYTGFEPATDTGDGCHPNVAGAQKMADATYEAVVAKGYF